jgi:acyl phosphate:glycerol-3-phosphate acyltransferase
LKGAVATGWILVIVHFDGPSCHCGDEQVLSMQITGLIFALVGHSFSCFTKFKGGKGVATAAGGFMVLMPYAMLVCLVVWIVTFYSSRYVSLASILGAIALPIAAFFFHQPPLLLGLAVIIAAFVVLRHRANITRLMNGTENKFAKKQNQPQPPKP